MVPFKVEMGGKLLISTDKVSHNRRTVTLRQKAKGKRQS